MIPHAGLNGTVVVGEVECDDEIFQYLHTRFDPAALVRMIGIEAYAQPFGAQLLHHLTQRREAGTRFAGHDILQGQSHAKTLRDRQERFQAVGEQRKHPGDLLLTAVGAGVDYDERSACQRDPLQNELVVLHSMVTLQCIRVSQIAVLSKRCIHRPYPNPGLVKHPAVFLNDPLGIGDEETVAGLDGCHAGGLQLGDRLLRPGQHRDIPVRNHWNILRVNG